MRHFVIDCRFAATPSGLGRFTRGLTAELLHTKPAAHWTLLVAPGTQPWWDPGADVHLIETSIPHYSLAEQFRLPGLLKNEYVDAYYAPHFNAPLRLRTPSVVTIHDFILHRFPNAASPLKQLAYRFLMRRVIRRAGAVCAVSPFVAQEIAAIYGSGAAAKTIVTGEGVEPEIAPASVDAQATVRQRYGLSRPFLLYVGNAKEHKNVPGLLAAFATAALPETDLVLVASGKEADAVVWPTGVIRLKNVPDADLPPLYSAAAACVTMSHHEGYCLPLVEALACGCPVVAPALTAIPGVVGGAEGVRLLPTTDPAVFAAAFRDLPKRPAPRRLVSWDGPAVIVREALERVSPKS